MAQPKTLSVSQVAVLRWIEGGCPAGVYEGTHHRITAGALRRRGLITTSGSGPTWKATIRKAGSAYLKWVDGPNRPQLRGKPTAPQAPKPERPAKPTPARVAVPTDLEGAHPIVRRTAKALDKAKPDNDGLIVVRAPGQFALELSPAEAPRALLALQAFAAEVLRRGWKLQPNEPAPGKRRSGASVLAGDHRYWIYIEEVCDRRDFTKTEIDEWRNSDWKWEREQRAGKLPPPQIKPRVPTGRLRFTVSGALSDRSHAFNDTDRLGLFVYRLHELFDLIDRWIAADNEYIARREQAERNREREARIEGERRRALALQERRAKRLLQEATDWQQAKLVRDYVDALEPQLDGLSDEDQERLGEWIVWARLWANHIDPTTALHRVRGLEKESQYWY